MERFIPVFIEDNIFKKQLLPKAIYTVNEILSKLQLHFAKMKNLILKSFENSKDKEQTTYHLKKRTKLRLTFFKFQILLKVQ